MTCTGPRRWDAGRVVIDANPDVVTFAPNPRCSSISSVATQVSLRVHLKQGWWVGKLEPSF